METIALLSLLILFGCLFVRYCVIIISAYTGVVMINPLIRDKTKNLRSCGPGLRIKWPWEEIVEDGQISLKKSPIFFEGDFETKDKSTIPLKIAFDVIPHEDYLTEYMKFNFTTICAAIQERLRSILSVLIHDRPDRETIMGSIKELAAAAEQTFHALQSEDGHHLEEYYGTNLKALMIADVALPKELKDAQTRREVVLKENEIRKLEMENLKKMAGTLVQESEKKGHKKPF